MKLNLFRNITRPRLKNDDDLGERAKKRDILHRIENKIMYRIQENTKTWRNALAAAEYDTNPSRTQLYRLYEDVMLDNKLTHLIELKQDRIQSIDFKLYNKSNDEYNEVETDKFKQQWFYTFINEFVNTAFWGHSLLQIDGSIDNQITSVTLVPRQNVLPEWQEYVPNYYDYRGESYVNDNQLYRWLIEIGGKFDLGLLKKIAPLILWKKYAIIFWTEFQEVFGAPIRIGKTTATRTEDKNRFYNYLKDMGSKSFAILSPNEEVEFKETTRSDAHAVYLEFINFINNEITGLILGATDNTSGGAVGSQARANVHDNQTNYKIMSELRTLVFCINEIVIPKLQGLGIVGDVYFKLEDKEVLPTTEKVNIDKELIGIIQSGLYSDSYITDRYNIELSENYLNGNLNETDNKQVTTDDK